MRRAVERKGKHETQSSASTSHLISSLDRFENSCSSSTSTQAQRREKGRRTADEFMGMKLELIMVNLGSCQPVAWGINGACPPPPCQPVC